ncbi:hypothetical protein HB779_06965 [Phyllobacterium sp. 628]|uniref:hypothetical protein n=1 Tax=Phyllobacterium sp. 628 TaxID=2718938 RepID=UPI0016627CAA|nr:hypothetical protein [Phyllobacterium sp. 628]QND51669.1 hypothetical protein HB779_06965 [Phyllobacterium sp. 628]
MVSYERGTVDTIVTDRQNLAWGGIFGGTLLAIAVQVLLGALGLGIGLSTISATGDGASAQGLGIGGGIWSAIAMIIALAIGGYVAAYFSGQYARWSGVLHGLVVWAAGLAIGLYLLGTAVGGAFGVLGSVASTAGSAVGQVASGAASTVKDMVPQAAEASGITKEQAGQEVDRLVDGVLNRDPAGTTSLSPEQARKEVVSALTAHALGEETTAETKQRVTGIIAAQLGISPDEANKRYDAAVAKIDDAKAKAAAKVEELKVQAKQAADKTAKLAASGSFAAFIAMLIGAIAAAIGGAAGIRRNR